MPDVRYYCGATTTEELDVTDQVRAACREEPRFVPVIGAIQPKRAQPELESRTAPAKQPDVVRIQCTDDHWCDFPCRPPAGVERVKGTPVKTGEATLWQTWRAYTDPLQGLARIEKYATWVLAADALIVLLAGSLATGGALKLETDLAKLLYALAIAFLGVSWAAVSVAIAPRWVRINAQSPTDFVAGFNEQYESRRSWLTLASIALGLALLLAAVVPLGGTAQDASISSAGITYDVKQGGAVEAKLSGVGLPPHTPVELVIRGAEPDYLVLRRKRMLVDSIGKADVSLTLDSIGSAAAAKPLRLTGSWRVWPGRGAEPRQTNVSVP